MISFVHTERPVCVYVTDYHFFLMFWAYSNMTVNFLILRQYLDKLHLTLTLALIVEKGEIVHYEECKLYFLLSNAVVISLLSFKSSWLY